MHWIYESKARVAIAHALQKDGWTVYGVKADESDSMTDYYSPAAWIEGIAEYKGYVFVTVGYSTPGGFETERTREVGPCEHCDGTGIDKNGWTYDQAIADPEAFNEQHLKKTFKDESTHMVALFPKVISPLYFKDGREKCVECHGSGKRYERYTVFNERPAYHPLEKGYSWHLEHDGEIIYRGKGLSTCIVNGEINSDGVSRIIDQVHRIINGGTRRTFNITTTNNPARDDQNATPKQLWYLHVLTGINTKGMTLSRARASELISTAKNGSVDEVTEQLRSVTV